MWFRQFACRIESIDAMTKRWLCWLVWLVGMGALYLFENNTATRSLLVASALLPLLFVVGTALNARRVNLKIEAPRRAAKEEEFAVNIQAAKALPFARTSISARSRNLLTGEERECNIVAQGTRAERCLICSEHCGLLEFTVKASVSDLFGLYRRDLETPLASPVFIPPRLFEMELAFAEGYGGEADNANAVRPGREPFETYAIREYMPGDSIRQIHWKLSQKTDTIMVRESGAEDSSRILLAIDISGESGENGCAAISAMAETFLSISRALWRAGLAHTLCWQEQSGDLPAYREIESEKDWAEACDAFFLNPPDGKRGLRSDERAVGFAHVVMVCSRVASARRFNLDARHTTVITMQGEGAEGEWRVATFSLPFDGKALNRVEL